MLTTIIKRFWNLFHCPLLSKHLTYLIIFMFIHHFYWHILFSSFFVPTVLRRLFIKAPCAVRRADILSSFQFDVWIRNGSTPLAGFRDIGCFESLKELSRVNLWPKLVWGGVQGGCRKTGATSTHRSAPNWFLEKQFVWFYL